MDPFGIVLMLSCRKFATARIGACKLTQTDLPPNWILVHVIADPSHVFKDKYLFTSIPPMTNLLVLGCEDSYIHLYKKLIFALTAIYDKYGEPKLGVVRTSEVKFVDIPLFISTLQSIPPGANFMGQVVYSPFIYSNNHMTNYYSTHPGELSEYDLTMNHIRQYEHRTIGMTVGCIGKIMYLSWTACHTLITHFNEHGRDVFTKIGETYPFIVEDTAILFVLYLHKIHVVDCPGLYKSIEYPQNSGEADRSLDSGTSAPRTPDTSS